MSVTRPGNVSPQLTPVPAAARRRNFRRARDREKPTHLATTGLSVVIDTVLSCPRLTHSRRSLLTAPEPVTTVSLGPGHKAHLRRTIQRSCRLGVRWIHRDRPDRSEERSTDPKGDRISLLMPGPCDLTRRVRPDSAARQRDLHSASAFPSTTPNEVLCVRIPPTPGLPRERSPAEWCTNPR